MPYELRENLKNEAIPNISANLGTMAMPEH